MKRLIVLIGILLSGSGLLCASESTDAVKTYPYIKPEFSERFRLVTWDNAISLDKSAQAGQTFTRHRTIAGGQLLVTRQIDFKITLGNEFRYYAVPEGKTAHGLNEVFVENAYARYRFGSSHLTTITLGRQNIILGEGFAVMDGNPLDGSRAIYFDAVRVDTRINESTTATVFACSQTPTDQRLPIIHDVDQALIEHDEDGAGVYISTKYRLTEFQPYYIYKNIPDWRLHTIGNRVNVILSKRAGITAEAAVQFGSDKTGLSDENRFGYAGYAYLDYAIQHPKLFPIEVRPGLFYYSGDDPYTSKNEGWDPLFARWPKWSESYIYTQINEGGVAYWSNVSALFLRLKLENITPGITCLLEYYSLYAPHERYIRTNEQGDILASESNIRRGDLFIIKLNFKVNEHVTGHMLWEGFLPGDFHTLPFDFHKNPSDYSWIRAELMYKL